MQTCDEELTIGELKRQLALLEKIDEDLIVLVHSGKELGDEVVPCLCGMEKYNGTGELFLDLQVLPVSSKSFCAAAPPVCSTRPLEAGENAGSSSRLSS